jgi:hypothetical protein
MQIPFFLRAAAPRFRSAVRVFARISRNPSIGRKGTGGSGFVPKLRNGLLQAFSAKLTYFNTRSFNCKALIIICKNRMNLQDAL